MLNKNYLSLALGIFFCFFQNKTALSFKVSVNRKIIIFTVIRILNLIYKCFLMCFPNNTFWCLFESFRLEWVLMLSDQHLIYSHLTTRTFSIWLEFCMSNIPPCRCRKHFSLVLRHVLSPFQSLTLVS